MISLRARTLLVACAVIVAGLTVLWHVRPGPRSERAIGLFTSLPILWNESADLAGLLDDAAPPHWARDAIARHGRLRPLDRLAGRDGALPLPAGALLIVAQPRPLSPEENVALDSWVRGGGRVLLFADPLLTAPSAFPLGDQRRPQDVVLLSPILTRWGLELRFDQRQPPGEREAVVLGRAMPVNQAGSFALRPGSGCALLAGGLAARCRIGAGTVLAVADAALLENGTDGDAPDRLAIFDALLQAFPG